ncbi:MAG: hypothetical protein AB8H03_04465, partial [Saprospiraceae bacterium]
MKNFILKFTFFLFLFFSIDTSAQLEEIILNNPSFEDFARPGKQPRGWYDCGDIKFPLETPPDTHPAELTNGNPIFGVTQKAFHGDTYLGLVYRETDTYESVSQKLMSKLLIGNIYSFTISLSTSDVYVSSIRNREYQKEVNFTTPVFLRIWGGIGFCDKKELLAQSPLINNTEWKDFTFFLEPKSDDISYILLEVASDDPVNGNLLIDNASTIYLEKVDSLERANLSLLRDEINERNKVKRLIEREITIKGTSIKFKDNQLTISGERKIRSILNVMQDLPDYKLIFDFNGLRK